MNHAVLSLAILLVLATAGCFPGDWQWTRQADNSMYDGANHDVHEHDAITDSTLSPDVAKHLDSSIADAVIDTTDDAVARDAMTDGEAGDVIGANDGFSDAVLSADRITDDATDAGGDSADGLTTTCTIGHTLCTDVCTMTAMDPNNCGVCGNRCASRVCLDGSCAPVGTLSGQRSCAPMVDGCGLVEIAGGTFTMGAPSMCGGTPDASCAYGASPMQPRVTVGNFALDAYEVTVARFRAFWAARPRDLPTIRSVPIPYPNGQQIAWGVTAQPPLPLDAIFNWSMTDTSRDAHPINGVDYWLAQEFCVWDGGRLPTESEWEYAARGRVADGLAVDRTYPWGDADPTSSCDRAQWNNCSGMDGGHTRRVGSFAASAGLYDMAGNCWEWAADNFSVYANTGPSDACANRTNIINPLCNFSSTSYRIMKGGSFGFSPIIGYLRSASRLELTPTVRDNVGMRCARTRP